MGVDTKTLAIDEMKRIHFQKGNEGFKKGELKTLFEKLADKYNLSFSTVKGSYYKEIKNKDNGFGTPMIQKAHSIQSIQRKNTSNRLESVYKIGETVKAKVTNVAEYGAFFITLDEHKREGLIHISEVCGVYIQDIHDYLEVNDVVEGKVKRVMPDGKIELSTREYFFQNKQVKVIDEKPKQKPVSSQKDDTFTDIMTFLNGMVGVLSPKAKEMLNEAINKHGLVKFTIAMIDAGKTFENDLGVKLLEEIKHKISDGL